MTQLVTTFRLGSSTVMTLPKNLGIVPGQRLEIKEKKEKITISRGKLDAARIARQHAGKLNLKYHPTIHEMKIMYDEDVYKLPYEKK